MNEWEWQLLESKSPVESVRVGDANLRAGARVRLHPRAGGDVMDLALDGKSAVVESIEQDYEGKFHVCVVVDEDPGRDIGLMRQPGHRFFFDAEEIEPVPADEALTSSRSMLPRILVAGIGNIFLGDDGFGVEVAQRMSSCKFPENVRVVDFGIRGLDLAYALDGYDVTILVDAYPRGEPAGTLSLIEPDLDDLNPPDGSPAIVEAHSMNPVNVLRMTKAMTGQLKRVLLVGCEPATLGPEEGLMGLSEPIAAAVDPAIKLIEDVIAKLENGKELGVRA